MTGFDPKKRDLLKATGAGLVLAAAPGLAAPGRADEVRVKGALIDHVLPRDWQFKAADAGDWLAATVPGTVHTDLLSNKQIGDPFYRTNERDQQWIDKKDWEYRTRFAIDPATLARDHVELFFEGLDTYADVYVNDALVLQADNMFREWRVDIKKLARPGDNDLRVYFHSPITVGLKKLAAYGFNLPATNDQSENGGTGANKLSVFTRKAGYAYGWDWGPRFVTSGVWRPAHLLAWNMARLDAVQLVQDSVSAQQARLTAVFEIVADTAGPATVDIQCPADPRITARAQVTLKPGANTVRLPFVIDNPKLWWSNGLGEAHLYGLTAGLSAPGGPLDRCDINLGVRTLKIVQTPDAAGSSFYVELNGAPVFMKGANYIPNDNFLPRVTHAVYDKVVGSAVKTHMNMLRAWGGGVYEDDYFYDLCDRNGILIWHDFMFACSMYPNDAGFLDNVRQEVTQNVRRLRNHPCIALWIGNNEIDSAWQNDVPNGGWGWKQGYNEAQRAKIWDGYDSIFHKILPSVLAENDPQRLYWPSSPLAGWGKHADVNSRQQTGDIHYWEVWGNNKPFADYRSHVGRFVSEYGFQSFPELRTVEAYAIAADFNIFSDVMQAHQRASGGNAKIQAYMERAYKVPADFRQFLNVGQVLQAEGIKTAMEAHRSRMPYCMGSLFWQINDCWPVASWSSIDYYGRWKAQQYFAVKAFDTVLVSPQIDGQTLSVYLVSDRMTDQAVTLNLRLMDFTGRIVSHKDVPLIMKANTGALVLSEDVATLLAGSAPQSVLLSARVLHEGRVIADNIAYFKAIKDVTLPTPTVRHTLKVEGRTAVVELTADALVKNLYLSLDDGDWVFSDNYFDILPGETAVVRITGDGAIDEKWFGAALKLLHMADVQA